MKLTDAPCCTCKPEQVGHLPECPWGTWVAKYEAEKTQEGDGEIPAEPPEKT